MIAYFVQAYVNHILFINDLRYMQSSLPVFMDRFRYMMLVYGFNRERLIMNNSLDTFEWIEGYGYNGDQYYDDRSVENELAIIDLKSSPEDPILPIVNFIKDIDSP